METRTKFILTFIGGVVTGFILTVFTGLFLSTIAAMEPYSNENVVMFKHPRPTIDGREFRVDQVLSDGSALASSEDIDHMGMTVLFPSDKNTSYYDDQKIIIPEGKKLMQIGIYQYGDIPSMVKTIPIVKVYKN